MNTTEQTVKDTINALTSKIDSWLGIGRGSHQECNHASVRRALLLPAEGASVVIRIRGAYWVGTAAQDYCFKLGETLDECLATLADLGMR